MVSALLRAVGRLRQVSEEPRGSKPETDMFGDSIDWGVRATGLKRSAVKRDAKRYLADSSVFCAATAPGRCSQRAHWLPGVCGGGHGACRARGCLGEGGPREPEATPRYGGGDWAVVLEMSDVVPGTVHANTEFAGDVGVQEERRSRAFRVVRPTPDEVKRFGGAHEEACAKRRGRIGRQAGCGRRPWRRVQNSV